MWEFIMSCHNLKMRFSTGLSVKKSTIEVVCYIVSHGSNHSHYNKEFIMPGHNFCWPRANQKTFILGTRKSGPNYGIAYQLAILDYHAKLAVALQKAKRFAEQACPPSCTYKKFVYYSDHDMKTRVYGNRLNGPVVVQISGGFKVNALCTRDKIEANLIKKRLAKKVDYKKAVAKKTTRKKAAKKKKVAKKRRA
jgi:hypothetical protein